jgi:hypothetical protein
MGDNTPTIGLNARSFFRRYADLLPRECAERQYGLDTWTGWVSYAVYGVAVENGCEPEREYGGIDFALRRGGVWVVALEHENLTDWDRLLEDYPKAINARARVRVFIGYARNRGMAMDYVGRLRDLYPSLILNVPGPEDETVISISWLKAGQRDAWVAYLRGPLSDSNCWQVMPFEQFEAGN